MNSIVTAAALTTNVSIQKEIYPRSLTYKTAVPPRRAQYYSRRLIIDLITDVESPAPMAGACTVYTEV